MGFTSFNSVNQYWTIKFSDPKKDMIKATNQKSVHVRLSNISTSLIRVFPKQKKTNGGEPLSSGHSLATLFSCQKGCTFSLKIYHGPENLQSPEDIALQKQYRDTGLSPRSLVSSATMIPRVKLPVFGGSNTGIVCCPRATPINGMRLPAFPGGPVKICLFMRDCTIGESGLITDSIPRQTGGRPRLLKRGRGLRISDIPGGLATPLFMITGMNSLNRFV